MLDSEITCRIVTHGDEIRVRWSAKMYLRDPTFSLCTLHIDGVSIYTLDSNGKIRTHQLDNIVSSDETEAASGSPGFFWLTPHQMATPELAFFSRSPTDVEVEECVPPGISTVPPLRSSSPRRTRTLLASEVVSDETPMQRAARERAEDAEKARRIADMRSPPKKKDGLFGLSSPQQCETSYECDAPMVCCDLIVLSVCCSGGILTGLPGPSLQRRAIPIPVEEDSPFPRP
jgi:hypothetical protein